MSIIPTWCTQKKLIKLNQLEEETIFFSFFLFRVTFVNSLNILFLHPAFLFIIAVERDHGAKHSL